MGFLDFIFKAPKNDVVFYLGLLVIVLGAVVSRIRVKDIEIISSGKSWLAIGIGIALVIFSYAITPGSKVSPPVIENVFTPPPPSPRPLSTGSSPTMLPVTTLTAKEAIEHYYVMVEQQQYEITFGMLSEGFKTRNGITLDIYKSGWEQSGPAKITEVVENTETGDYATVTADVYYYRPDKQVRHTLRHYLARYKECADVTFGCWQIMRVEDLSRPN